jgi:hypothetical protein
MARIYAGFGDGRTGAAVHEESTLLEELSGHTVSHVSYLSRILCGRGRILGKLLDVLHGD